MHLWRVLLELYVPLSETCLNHTPIFIQAARNVAFLLDAKGSENAQGEFSEYPPGNPKTPHTPTSERQSKENRSPPLSKGGKKGNVSKRIKDKGTNTYEKSE